MSDQKKKWAAQVSSIGIVIGGGAVAAGLSYLGYKGTTPTLERDEVRTIYPMARPTLKDLAILSNYSEKMAALKKILK